MGTVSLVKVSDNIKQSLITCLDNIGGLKNYVKSTDRVLLKPNINGTEGNTNIAIVESLILLLLEMGNRQITIAESTFGNAAMTDLCFVKTGYSDLANKYAIPLINLNKSRAVKVRVRSPLVTDEVNIAEEVFNADVIINIPVMKVHYATGITLSLKNMKGLLVGDEKRRFHEIGLDKAIVDLNNTIRPTLNIIDCTSCMERMGPRGGDIVKMNLLIAGDNRGDVDYVGSQIMGYALNDVQHLKLYLECSDLNVDDIVVVGENIENSKRPFVKVTMDTVIPKSFRIYNTNACSSCMNAFLLSCQFLDKGCNVSADIFMGDASSDNAGNGKQRIAFGNCCTKSTVTFDEKVIGCPPYPFALKKTIEKSNKP